MFHPLYQKQEQI